MAGYATLGRVEGGRVRALAWRRPSPDESPPETRPPVAGREPAPRRPLREVIPELWQDAREELAMTTFFLLDPESWR
jgi:hypothetical protein